MKSRIYLLISLLLCFLLFYGCAPAKPAEPVEDVSKGEVAKEITLDTAADFYKGKKVRFIVPYTPGGGYDLIARSLAPYLEKYTGAQFIVENIPGAGGNVGAEYVFKARPDGLTIGILNNLGQMMTQLFDPELVGFDLAEYTNIGRVTAEPVIMYAKAGGPLATMQDVLKSDKALNIAVLGPGDDQFLTAAGTVEAFNFPAKLISGYPGQADAELAVIRAETDLAFGSIGSRYPMVEAGEIKPLIYYGDEIPKFLIGKTGDIPPARDFVTSTEGKVIVNALDTLQGIHRGIMGPPGIPEDRRKFLEEALVKSLSETKLIEDWEKAARIISWMPGNEYVELIKGLTEIPAPLANAYFEAVRELE